MDTAKKKRPTYPPTKGYITTLAVKRQIAQKMKILAGKKNLELRQATDQALREYIERNSEYLLHAEQVDVRTAANELLNKVLNPDPPTLPGDR